MKKYALVLFLFVVCTSVVFSQFYKDFSPAERKHLAEAYYLVGLQYREVGKLDKGDDFVWMAKRIYPELKPETIDPEMVRRGRPIEVYAAWRPSPASVPQGEAASKAIQYRLFRFLQGFYTEETEVFRNILNDTVYAPPIPTGVDIESAIAYAEKYFEEQPLSETPPQEMFDIQSITAEQLTRNVWYATLDFKKSDPFNLISYLDNTSLTQNFFFQIEDDKWKLFAAGFDPDEMQHIITPKTSIKKTIINCIEAFINKDADKAVTYFTDPFMRIPFDKPITRSELKETFIGYFEEFDFSSLTSVTLTVDVVKEEQLPTVEGITYKATIDFPHYIADKLPLWPDFSGYYFAYDETEAMWKIAAVF